MHPADECIDNSEAMPWAVERSCCTINTLRVECSAIFDRCVIKSGDLCNNIISSRGQSSISEYIGFTPATVTTVSHDNPSVLINCHLAHYYQVNNVPWYEPTPEEYFRGSVLKLLIRHLLNLLEAG